MPIKSKVMNYTNVSMPTLVCDACIDSGKQTFEVRDIDKREVPLDKAIEEVEGLLVLMKQSLKKDT